MLQIAFKAINNIIRLNNLVSTFLVLNAYFCMIMDLSSLFLQ